MQYRRVLLIGYLTATELATGLFEVHSAAVQGAFVITTVLDAHAASCSRRQTLKVRQSTILPEVPHFAGLLA